VTNGSDRLDRIEDILDRLAKRDEEFDKRHADSMDKVDKHLEYMAARQQYHDDAFERFDAEMKIMKEAQERDGENIRALARIAELHHLRLENLEGGEPA
jgi:predicted outer membrane protein